ncbi:hypothetical protein IHE56_15305 [Streptomyces sp. ID01-12c]|uniref:hypothetical protein n=1 Tax=Streptomyces caniscabiei TaxID=2746961 RepID=UPI00177F97CD|nr:hypothetical protein [Streptomyces caniscabiei]MBD9703425.1 hypothetical protein [Streptomyces caniscabiei]MDX3726916.1 hypothetical protein [Streptomyces caniscabiei]
MTGNGLALWLLITCTATGTGLALWLLKLLLDRDSDRHATDAEDTSQDTDHPTSILIWSTSGAPLNPPSHAPHAHTAACTGDPLTRPTLPVRPARHAKPRTAS